MIRSLLTYALVVVLLSAPCRGQESQPNQLTEAERKTGWKLLFDGSTWANWSLSKLAKESEWWTIEDGWVRTRGVAQGQQPRFADGRRLRTLEAYRNFDLQFEFKIAKGGNSGVKYRLQGFWSGLDRETQTPRPVVPLTAGNAHDTNTPLGFEYQITDDENAVDALAAPSRSTAALYRIAAPKKSGPVTADTAHLARIVVNGTRFEHWLDGKKVADGDLTSGDTRAILQSNRVGGERKFKEAVSFRDRYDGALEMIQAESLLRMAVPESPIDFTDHYSGVWFRNIKVRALP